MTQANDADSHQSPPRFCADVMLGRLAKWLRILGLDVLYSNDAEDEELLQTCEEDDRILLTRDTQLAERASRTVKVVFVEHDHVKDQLASLRSKLPLPAGASSLFSRCLLCNTELQAATRPEVEDRVPAFVFNSVSEFRQCPKCGKVYWKGTHVDHAVRALLESISEKQE